MPDLKDFEKLTEETKSAMITWLGETLDFLENNTGNTYNNNRVFGTDKDDIDEARNVLGVMFLTLQQNTLVDVKVMAKDTVVNTATGNVYKDCPDCGSLLKVDTANGNIELIKHKV